MKSFNLTLISNKDGTCFSIYQLFYLFIIWLYFWTEKRNVIYWVPWRPIAIKDYSRTTDYKSLYLPWKCHFYLIYKTYRDKIINLKSCKCKVLLSRCNFYLLVHLFFVFGYTVQLVGSWFPKQGWNSCPWQGDSRALTNTVRVFPMQSVFFFFYSKL